jgi:large subunit ribosomal protein L15
MPLQRRIPKRGFTNTFRKEYNIINVKDLNRFGSNTTLDVAALKEAGMIKRANADVKLLGKGEITHPVTITVQKVSHAAKLKIEAAGGKVELS